MQHESARAIACLAIGEVFADPDTHVLSERAT